MSAISLFRCALCALAVLVPVGCAGAEAGAGDPASEVSAEAGVGRARAGEGAVAGGRAAPSPSAAAAKGGVLVAHGDAAGDTMAADAATAAQARAAAGPGGGAPAVRAAGAPAHARAGPAPVRIPAEPPSFERPDHVRGVYLNKWVAGSPRRLEALIALAQRTTVNAFVIDLKDATGYLSYASGVPLAREIGALGKISIQDLPALLERLSEEGIWPIARIVMVKDPLLVAARPHLAVQDTAGGPWVDGNGSVWLNPWQRDVLDYHVALAREAAALGFPEIQWDYVRFPDAPRSELARATLPGSDGREKSQAIRAFLELAGQALDELGALQTADVFGVTTSARDVGIGQVWEHFIDRVDVALPMVYPSHYWRGSFGYERPNAHPYEIVREALRRGLARSEDVEGAGTIRPWLQDFDLGEPAYGAPEVLAQIQAAYDLGIEEWVLWNAASRYTEAALEPEGGWEEEPLIRVAGRLVPLSRRHEALRLAEAPGEEVPATEVAPRSAPTVRGPEQPRTSPPDTARPRILPPDSLRAWLDRLRARDTLRAG